jgi:hypothetical protein
MLQFVVTMASIWIGPIAFFFRTVIFKSKVYILALPLHQQRGPYNDENTASRLLSEVKHRLARLVLRWGTTLESRVFSFCFLPAST